jgi:hypothetical protein
MAMARCFAKFCVGLIAFTTGCDRHRERDTADLRIAADDEIRVSILNESEFVSGFSEGRRESRLLIGVNVPEGAKPASGVRVEAIKAGVAHLSVMAELTQQDPPDEQVFEYVVVKPNSSGKYRIKATAMFHRFDFEDGTLETVAVESDSIELEVES